VTLDSHTATNVTLLAALYFVIGQAFAHPIVAKATESKKLSRKLRIRFGIAFGVAWPLLLMRLVTIIAAKAAQFEAGDEPNRGVTRKRGRDERGVHQHGANDRGPHEHGANEHGANEHGAHDRGVTDDEPARRDET
jgi:hypothetical protein